MKRISDILVIGGGISGLLVARELAAAGYATTLIEKQKVGSEASKAGGGILFPISPWRQSEAVMALWKLSDSIYPNLASELKEASGIDPEWHRCGLAILDTPRDESLNWCRKHSVPAYDFAPNRARQRLPRVEIPDRPVLWLPEIAQIRNPRMLAALRLSLEKQGVTIFEDTEVISIAIKNSRIISVQTNRNTFCASETVIAAGAWSKKLFGSLKPEPDIVPVKGQMLLYKSSPDLLKTILLYQDRYLIPRLDGHILVGSTLEFSGYDKSTTMEAKQNLDTFARRVLPGLPKNALIDQWAGLRPGSPSGIPYIGRHPVIKNLSFNCGHFRNGFGIGPASARLLVDLLSDRRPSLPPEPYSLEASR